MTELYLAGAVLILLAWVFVLPALLGSRSRVTASGREAQAAFYRQRLEELKKERDLNALDQQQFEELEVELERQLLAETGEEEGSARRAGLARWPLVLVMLVLPLLSYWSYLNLGAPADLALNRLEQKVAAQQSMTPEDLTAMRRLVDSGLEYQPDKIALLSLQARLAMQAGDYREAADAYQRLVDRHPESGAMLAQWAQAIYLAEGRRLTPRVRDLLDRALAADPNQPTALGMLGIDAFSHQNYVQAIEYWQRLLRASPPGSSELGIIASGVQQAKALAVEAGQLEGLGVSVDIAPSLADREAGTLYVFAKADDGIPLPVAVVRQPAAGEWPRRVVLTDADAMRSERHLSQFETVTVTARISRGGSVMAQPGDLEGQVTGIDVGERRQPVQIVIDRVVE